MKAVVYIAGPYMGANWLEIDANITEARKAAAWLAQHSIGFFCPHLNSAHFEVVTPDVSEMFWKELDLRMLDACDALYLLPGWQHSSGSMAEKKYFVDRYPRRPVFESLIKVAEWAEGVDAAG